LAERLIKQHRKPTKRAVDINGNCFLYATAKAWFTTKVRLYVAHLQQQCHNSKFMIFLGETFMFWSAVLFYECNDDTTALQRRVLQTALWHYTC